MPPHLQHLHSSVGVLHTGRGDDYAEKQPERIDEEMTRAPFDLLASIVATDPPFSVVFTDWLAMIPALGWRCLPEATRTSPRSRACISAHVPSKRH
jgi:hypothetical protein